MSNNLKKERYSPVDPLLMEEAEVVEMNEILGRGEVPAMRVVVMAGKGKMPISVGYSSAPNPPSGEGVE